MAMHGDVQWQFWCAADHPAVVTNWVTVQTCMRGKPSSCTTLRQYGSCGKGSIMAQLQLCQNSWYSCAVSALHWYNSAVCARGVHMTHGINSGVRGDAWSVMLSPCNTWHQQCHTV